MSRPRRRRGVARRETYIGETSAPCADRKSNNVKMTARRLRYTVRKDLPPKLADSITVLRDGEIRESESRLVIFRHIHVHGTISKYRSCNYFIVICSCNKRRVEIIQYVPL